MGVGPTRPAKVVDLVGGPIHLQSSLVASHVSSYPFSTCLSFWYVGLALYVGPLIHTSLNSALSLVDDFSHGSQGRHNLHFSPIFHLCIISKGIVDFYFILDKNAYEVFEL